jgi:hypothetical protein
VGNRSGVRVPDRGPVVYRGPAVAAPDAVTSPAHPATPGASVPQLTRHISHPHIIHLPPWRQLAKTTAENLLEATVVPMALFYLVLGTIGFRWALVAGLGWSYAAIGRRLMTRQRMPGLLVMGAALMTARFAIAMSTGSVFIYFLQPTLGTFCVAGLFLLSVSLRKPLAERLAHDFCALPDTLVSNVRVKRFFHHISLLWACVYLVNGSMTLYLLMSASMGQFLVLRFAVSIGCMVTAISVSTAYFFRSLKDENIVLRWRGAPAAAVPASAAA